MTISAGSNEDAGFEALALRITVVVRQRSRKALANTGSGDTCVSAPKLVYEHLALSFEDAH